MILVNVHYSISSVRLVKSVFNLNPAFRPLPGPTQLRLDFKHSGIYDKTSTILALRQNFKTGNDPNLIPFFFEVELESTIHLGGVAVSQDRDLFIHKVMPPLVFPFTREYIAELTRRSGYSPLLISPAFNFDHPAPVPIDPGQYN